MATWGCDWHAVNETILAHAQLLVDDPERIGPIQAIGMDQTPFNRLGEYRTQQWATTFDSPLKPEGPPISNARPARRSLVGVGDRYIRWRSVHALEIRGPCNSNGCALVQRPYLTPTPALGGSRTYWSQRIGERPRAPVTVFNRRISATTRYRR
jgi:hypothetical protein